MLIWKSERKEEKETKTKENERKSKIKRRKGREKRTTDNRRKGIERTMLIWKLEKKGRKEKENNDMYTDKWKDMKGKEGQERKMKEKMTKGRKWDGRSFHS